MPFGRPINDANRLTIPAHGPTEIQMIISTQPFPLPQNLHLANPCLYFGSCFLFALVIRIVNSVFKAGSIVKEDEPKCDGYTSKGFRKEFFYALGGMHRPYFDLGLPFLIGFAELMAYPFLFKTAHTEVIGGWLLIRAAAGWSGWSKSRTSYYRFLLSSLMTVFFAYFWLSRFAC